MAPFEYDKLVFIGFFAALRMTSVYWNKQLLGKNVYRNKHKKRGIPAEWGIGHFGFKSRPLFK